MPTDRTLKVASLGEDPLLLELLEAVVARSDCRWLASAEAGEQIRQRAAQQVPTVALWDDWEQLASSDQVDLVLVSSRPHADESATRRAAALRRLFQNHVPLVLVHPGCEMILAYELEMIRRDTGTRVFAYTPLLVVEDLESLRSISGDGSSGSPSACKQWVWERTLKPDPRHLATGLHRDAALDAFASDAIVLRQLLGDAAQVTGAGVQAEDEDYSHLTVHLHTADQRMARWTVIPSKDTERIKTTALGAGQTIHWHVRADGRESQLWQADGSDEAAPAPAHRVSPSSPAALFMDDVLAALRSPDAATSSRLIGWEEVCRALEVTDGVVRSCQRRRTIDLYHEQVSEQATFKSVMAAGGCAMLMWVLAMLLIAGIVEGLELPIRDMAIWRLYPLAIFLPLAFFLGLQLLQLVFPPTKNQAP